MLVFDDATSPDSSRANDRRSVATASQLAQEREALALLEACSLRRCSALVNTTVEPDFDVLRPEPRFQQLVRAVDPDAVASGR